MKKDKKTYRMKKKSNPYYQSEGNKESIDLTNFEAIDFEIEKLNQLRKDRELNDQFVRHGQFPSIL